MPFLPTGAKVWYNEGSGGHFGEARERAEAMIYECEQCDTVLPAGVTACPGCGEKFDEAVPDDAEAPMKASPPVPPGPGLTSSGLSERRKVQELMNKHRERFKIDEETRRLIAEAEGDEEAEGEE